MVTKPPVSLTSMVYARRLGTAWLHACNSRAEVASMIIFERAFFLRDVADGIVSGDGATRLNVSRW